MTNNNGGRLFLRSVRIDNYKCISGLEMPFGDMTLLLGKNGCGKTAVFEVINALSRFVCHGAQIADLFPFSTLPKWHWLLLKQSFELHAGNGNDDDDFCYRLVVEHTPPIDNMQNSRVASETLTLGGRPLFEFADGKARWHKYERKIHSGDATFSFEGNGSALANVESSIDNYPLQIFRNWMRGITLLSPKPEKMGSGAYDEAQYLDADGGNFVSWYRGIVQEDRKGIDAADEALRRVLPGYRRLKLVKVGDDNYREMVVVFASEDGKEYNYSFDELSDGQRVLIALYCFLYGGGCNRLLLLDEPDNFVTLPEVQPLFSELEMDAGGDLPQVALISHHPQAMDFFSTRDMVWMKRDAEQPARIVKFENKTGLHTSQLCAQGGTP